MKKILFLLATVVAVHSFAQTNALVGVTIVTPKLGHEIAFEDAWKAHLKKFHQADTSNRRGVYEITSGVHQGSYYLTSSGMSWADMDVDRPNDKAHDIDFASTITTHLESASGNTIYRWADTLSYRQDVPATKFLFTIYHIKAGKQNDVTDEIKRAITINKKINSQFSYDGYIQMLSGSEPEVVIIRHLKDGFKELDPDYLKGNSDRFQAAYLEMYGQAAWDKRMNITADDMTLVEQQMVKYRADLSSVR